VIPVPLLVTLSFGAPLRVKPGEDKPRSSSARRRRFSRCAGRRCEHGSAHAREQTIALFAGVGVILIVASLVGFALKRAVAKGAPHSVIDNLNARVKAWWVMVAVIGLAFMGGRAGVTLLFLFVSFAACASSCRFPTRAPGTTTRDRELLRRATGPVRARVRRLVRALHDLHPGLRVPVPADPRRRRGRHDAIPGARLEDAWA
jgi:hypothetical protein